MKGTLLALLVATAVCGAAPAAAGAEEDPVARFRKAFSGHDSPGSPPEDAERLAAERLSAARAIALVDTRAAAEQVCRGVEATLAALEALAEERSRLREEIAALGPTGERDAQGARRAKELLAVEEELRRRDGARLEILSTLRRTLSAFREARAVDYLSGTVLRSGSSSGGLKAAVAEALGLIGDPSALRGVRQALRDKDPAVREAALTALGRLRQKEEEALASLVPALEDDRWTVRLAAMRQLAALATPRAVDALVDRLGKEEGRLRADLAALLRALTKQGFGIEPEGWTHWWKENREAFVSGERELARPEADPVGSAAPSGGGDGVSYHGITTHSRRILYVLDISGSMNSPGASSVEVLKIDEAKKELVRSIRSLGPDASFSIIAYGDAVRTWKPSLVPASGKHKEEAGRWVGDLMAASWTNTYAALEEGIRASAADPRNNMGPQYAAAADTIFLLSDGAPTTPEGKLEDAKGNRETERVLRAMAEWNREKRVVVHAIGIGLDADETFLRALARQNGGEYRKVR